MLSSLHSSSYAFISIYLRPISQNHLSLLFIFFTQMDKQEKEALEFFEEFLKKQQAEEGMDVSHNTKREERVTFNIHPSNLLCLAEQRIDLVNLFLNDFSLYED